MFSTTSFEVQTSHEGRWSIHSVVMAEDMAVMLATQLLGRGTYEAVKVVRQRKGITGREFEQVVFEKQAQMRETNANVAAAIDVVPYCNDRVDLFAVDARIAVNRIIRPFMDKNGVTAAELLHNFRELKRVYDADALLHSALSKVASVQAGDTGGDAKARLKAMESMVNDTLRINKRAEARRDLPLFNRDAGVVELLARLESYESDQFTRQYLAGVAICRETCALRDLYGKLVVLVESADREEPTPDAYRLLDLFIADTLTSSQVVAETLGQMRNLAQAIHNLASLSEGTLERLDEKAFALKLSRLMASGKMVDTRQVIFDRIRRALKSAQALSQDDENAQIQLLSDLIHKLSAPYGTLGGPNMAAALVERYARIRNTGGGAGMRQSIQGVIHYARTAWSEMILLLDLLESEIGADHAADIHRLLLETMKEARNPIAFTAMFRAPQDKRRALILAKNRVLDTPLEPDAKQALEHRLDRLRDAIPVPETA